VEGHTDSVGGDDYNQQLSERRGGSVRDDLITQGMAADSVTSAGFGKTMPMASKRYRGGAATKPARGISDFRRCDRYRGRHTARG
jgi:OOP family OmpA-OmpF porin